MKEPPDLPWNDVTRLMRRLSHNLRNHLNTADLEAAFASDLVTSDEAVESLANIRRSVRKVSEDLSVLVDLMTVNPPEKMTCQQEEVYMIWQQEVRRKIAPESISWLPALKSGAELEIDLAQTTWSLAQLAENAVLFAESNTPCRINCVADPTSFSFQIREYKRDCPDFAHWGTQPFASTLPQRFGLGLWKALRYLEQNGAALTREYQPEAHDLLTDISFPRLS